ncbi:hypothetical protein WKK05_41030 (plasmid) [Nostoc sp. UHCC 0302]|uniref:hypothetical protein n=1 Tax=Nostoc sp. UHCC 0302 TaxID=3134896 RepID=UPI00311C8AAB
MNSNTFSLLDEMKSTWGQTFEQLNNSERLWLLSSLVGTMTADATAYYDPNEVDDCITVATERFDELSFSEQLGLAEALINQIKSNLPKR